MRVPPCTRPPLLAVLGAAALALPAVATAAPAAPCPTAADLQQPFLRFVDPASYFLAPGGAFESGAWSGGSTAYLNEPFRVRRGGRFDYRSLAVAAPSSATSPPTCIGLEDPTIRLFALRAAGPPTAMLDVSVTFVDTLGQVRTLPLAPVVAPANRSWVLSAPIPILANAAFLPQALGVDPVFGRPASSVRFTLTPSPGSSWLVDDVFVDPYQRN